MKIRLALLLGLFAGTLPARAHEQMCPAGDLKTLESLLRKNSAEELVFFASWCSSCKDHLQEASDQQILIASFDQQRAVEKVLRVVAQKGRSLRCIWDERGEIAAHYGVKGVPAKRRLGP